MSDVPPKVLARLRVLRGARVEIHVVLEEEEVETKVGEGRFLHLRAAFFDLAAATARRDRLIKENEERLKESGATLGYTYHLKAIGLIPDEWKKQILTDSAYPTREIIRLLAPR